jgi:sugar phosphate permease
LTLSALLYAIAYLDRVNVGFVAESMSRDLRLDAWAFGLGAGMFFLGYVLFEIPSNVILQRIGARLWIARIMITWGLISCAMTFVASAPAFWALRFALGAAEAGFFPGMILYLGRWFTTPERARSIAVFMAATAIAGLVAAPLSGLILSFAPGGLRPWQWLFLLEGFPAVLLGIYVYRRLDERPSEAAWLTEAQRQALVAVLHEERLNIGVDLVSTRSLLALPSIWILSLSYFGLVATLYGIGFWFSTIATKAFHTTPGRGAVIAGVPYLSAAITMLLIASRADRLGHWKRGAVVCSLAASTALAVSAGWEQPVVLVFAISAASASTWAALPLFWAMVTPYLARSAPARGIALINSIGNIGGFAGPVIVGALYDRAHRFGPALAVLAVAPAAAALLLHVANGVNDPRTTSK